MMDELIVVENVNRIYHPIYTKRMPEYEGSTLIAIRNANLEIREVACPNYFSVFLAVKMQYTSGPQRLLKSIEIPIAECESLTITQDKAQGSVTGWLVWPVAHEFTKFLMENSSLLVGKSVLELGAGTGLIGLVCACAGARSVVISDIREGLPMCQSNVAANCAVTPTECTVAVEELFWGNDDHLANILTTTGPIDVIVASDVVYHQSEEALVSLAKTIISASNRDTIVLIAYEDREGLMDDELYFFGPMRERFQSLDLVDLGNTRLIFRFSHFIE